MAAKRVEWQYHRTRLRTPCNFMASLTMTFARTRIKVYSSSGGTWMPCLSEWKRLGIGLASRLALRLASSCFSSTPIVGLPEIKASESATDTTIQCFSLFQATGIDRASSCFSSTPIVGLPEIKASESATDTTIQCFSLFQATGIDFFLFNISILLIVLPPETWPLDRD